MVMVAFSPRSSKASRRTRRTVSSPGMTATVITSGFHHEIDRYR
ncbi:hypothetical protein OG339_47750 (plasmid) [Streptosporangium sp. NBC_01495]|nr:hypothetical protein [Streptosporangium sp. NBC_01495]